jgi:hypothetical protein
MIAPFTPPRPIARRAFLRGAGVAMALPMLEAMTPAFGGQRPRGQGAAATPRRIVAIESALGFMPDLFFPTGAGRDYQASPYLEILKAHREKFSVFSGTSHPDVDGGHNAEMVFLTGAPHPGRTSFKNTISLDQFAAERIGTLTRFPSFTLQVTSEPVFSLSFTRSGVKIPAETSPAAIYKQMFVQGDLKAMRDRIIDLRSGRSVLDFVADNAKRLERDLGPGDRAKLDQYYTSVRELEEQLVRSEAWERRPKPRAKTPAPSDVADTRQVIPRMKLMFDMVALALESDSTRLVTLFISMMSTTPSIGGVHHETHSLSHHGGRPETIAELRRVEEAELRVFGEFLSRLDRTAEGPETLLDRTMVLHGSCLGNANGHTNNNLPILLAGGGFRHGSHHVFDLNRNQPLPNLYLSMLHRLGIEANSFASSTGALRGLELI